MGKGTPIDINIDEPRYDQDTYIGRAKHFFQTTNPLNIFVTNTRLEEAKCLLTKYRLKLPLPPGTTEEDLWRAKIIYDSAYHPDTGEKMFLVGRMSFQMPGNMLICSGMMTFYKSWAAVVFWQWFNQSFNAVVNYTNGSGESTFTEKQLFGAYMAATGGAVGTALGLNHVLRNAPPLFGRWVPLLAVIVANCINIPAMRMQELQNGTPVFDSNNNELGYSRRAARKGILQVIVSRIFMPMPALGLTPVLMNHLDKKGILGKYPWISLPTNVGIVGLFVVIVNPLACAFFKQKARMEVDKLEPEVRASVVEKFSGAPPDYVYFNKGL
ncbi:sideroflexin-1-3-like isoform X2 [Tenebrio molitor]|uniref:sideroflexin-1-3-like isoform X2 n=1 Tax=Tenebrio molitor TaxID=7067 RepID=UPI0036249C54